MLTESYISSVTVGYGVIWGIFYVITVEQWIGIVLFLVAFYLVGLSGRNDEKKVNKKWIVCAHDQ